MKISPLLFPSCFFAACNKINGISCQQIGHGQGIAMKFEQRKTNAFSCRISCVDILQPYSFVYQLAGSFARECANNSKPFIYFNWGMNENIWDKISVGGS